MVSIIFLLFAYCIWDVCAYYSINPLSPPPSNSVQMSLQYPSQLDGQQGKMVDVKFDVKSKKMITEYANLSITNIDGHLLTGIYQDGHLISNSDILSVEIGFDNAQPMITGTLATDNRLGQTHNRFYSSLSVGLVRKNGHCSNSSAIPLETFWNRDFYFPVAGDYSPSMIIQFYNGSMVEYTDNKIKLHVSSGSEIQTQALNQINVLIALILLIFGYIEALKLVIDIT